MMTVIGDVIIYTFATIGVISTISIFVRAGLELYLEWKQERDLIKWKNGE